MENILQSFKSFKKAYAAQYYEILTKFTIIDEFEAIGINPTEKDIDGVYQTYMDDDDMNSVLIQCVQDYCSKREE